jgi:hypothetical protein
MASKIWKSMLMTCAFTRERVFQCPCHQVALVSFFIKGIPGGWWPYATSSTWLDDWVSASVVLGCCYLLPWFGSVRVSGRFSVRVRFGSCAGRLVAVCRVACLGLRDYLLITVVSQ